MRLNVDNLRGEVGLDPSRGSGGFLQAAVDYAKAKANPQAARKAFAIARRGRRLTLTIPRRRCRGLTYLGRSDRSVQEQDLNLLRCCGPKCPRR